MNTRVLLNIISQFCVKIFRLLDFSKDRIGPELGVSKKTADSGVSRCMTAEYLHAKSALKEIYLWLTRENMQPFCRHSEYVQKYDFFRPYLVLHSILVTGVHTFQEGTIHLHEESFDATANMAESTVLIATGLLVLVIPMFTWGIHPLIPVAGTLYGLSQDILIGFITSCLGVVCKWIALLAVMLTLSLVSVM